MFFKKKVESTTINLALNVHEAWQFTRENLKKADSWVRIHSNNVHLISQFGGELIWIELSGSREAKIYPGDWLIQQEGIGFWAISDEEKKTYWKEVSVR